METYKDSPIIRIRIVPDECTSFEDMYGDTFSREANPDIPEERMAKKEATARESFERDGAWGIAVDILCPACHTYHYWSGVYAMEYTYAHDPENEYRKELEREALEEYNQRKQKLIESLKGGEA